MIHPRIGEYLPAKAEKREIRIIIIIIRRRRRRRRTRTRRKVVFDWKKLINIMQHNGMGHLKILNVKPFGASSNQWALRLR
jgi:hypothetical protein